VCSGCCSLFENNPIVRKYFNLSRLRINRSKVSVGQRPRLKSQPPPMSVLTPVPTLFSKSAITELMTIEEDIKSVISQLGRLQLEQSELIARLDQLNTRRERESRASAPPSNPSYVPTPNDAGFSLGDIVVIANPGQNQENKGKVVKISDSTFLSNVRIVVETPTKQRIQHAPKNLRHDRDYSY
jgi:hypothetical protein